MTQMSRGNLDVPSAERRGLRMGTKAHRNIYAYFIAYGSKIQPCLLSFSTEFCPAAARPNGGRPGPVSGQGLPFHEGSSIGSTCAPPNRGGAHIRGKDTGFDDAGIAALERGRRTRSSSTPPQGRGVPRGTSLKAVVKNGLEGPLFNSIASAQKLQGFFTTTSAFHPAPKSVPERAASRDQPRNRLQRVHLRAKIFCAFLRISLYNKAAEKLFRTAETERTVCP